MKGVKAMREEYVRGQKKNAATEDSKKRPQTRQQQTAIQGRQILGRALRLSIDISQRLNYKCLPLAHITKFTVDAPVKVGFLILQNESKPIHTWAAYNVDA